MGYTQVFLAIGAMVLTMAAFAAFVLWYHANISHIRDSGADPIETLAEIMAAARWTFLAMTIYALNWFWGLATGLAIVREAKKAESTGTRSAKVPPRLF